MKQLSISSGIIQKKGLTMNFIETPSITILGCLQTTQTTSTRNARVPKKEIGSSTTINFEDVRKIIIRHLRIRQCSARYTDLQLVFLPLYLL